MVFRILRRSIEQGELLNFLIGCSLFLVAAAPLLVVHQFTQTYRSLFTLTAIEVLVLFWLLKQLPIGAARLAAIFAANRYCLFICRRLRHVRIGSRRDTRSIHDQWLASLRIRYALSLFCVQISRDGHLGLI